MHHWELCEAHPGRHRPDLSFIHVDVGRINTVASRNVRLLCYFFRGPRPLRIYPGKKRTSPFFMTEAVEYIVTT